MIVRTLILILLSGALRADDRLLSYEVRDGDRWLTVIPLTERIAYLVPNSQHDEFADQPEPVVIGWTPGRLLGLLALLATSLNGLGWVLSVARGGHRSASQAVSVRRE